MPHAGSIVPAQLWDHVPLIPATFRTRDRIHPRSQKAANPFIGPLLGTLLGSLIVEEKNAHAFSGCTPNEAVLEYGAALLAGHLLDDLASSTALVFHSDRNQHDPLLCM